MYVSTSISDTIQDDQKRGGKCGIMDDRCNNSVGNCNSKSNSSSNSKNTSNSNNHKNSKAIVIAIEKIY